MLLCKSRRTVITFCCACLINVSKCRGRRVLCPWRLCSARRCRGRRERPGFGVPLKGTLTFRRKEPGIEWPTPRLVDDRLYLPRRGSAGCCKLFGRHDAPCCLFPRWVNVTFVFVLMVFACFPIAVVVSEGELSYCCSAIRSLVVCKVVYWFYRCIHSCCRVHSPFYIVLFCNTGFMGNTAFV